jgi:hypothetical protein
VTVGATLVASLLAVLERPATWPLALLGFLIRGGIVLVIAPIIVLPTAIGLANVVAPVLTSALLSGLTATVVLLVAAVGAAGMLWLIGGGLLAAAADDEGIRWIAAADSAEGAVVADGAGGADVAGVAGAADVAGDPAVAGAAPSALHAPNGLSDLARAPGHAWRILTVRLTAHLPLLLALTWGSTRIVAAAYREFTVPVDTVTPLVLRVLRAVPDAVAIVLIAWLIGEVVGGLASRYVVIGQQSPARALVSALGQVVRHPVRTLVQTVVPLAGLVLVLVPSAAAAAAAWTAIRVSLVDGLPIALTLGAVLLLVVVWVGQLVLLGLVAAWRGAVWTVEVARTFGGVTARREGDWYPAVASGSLGDPSGTGSRIGSEDHP